MEPWQSWAILLLGSGAAYYYYTKRHSDRTRPDRTSISSGTIAPKGVRRRGDVKLDGGGDVGKVKKVVGAKTVLGGEVSDEANTDTNRRDRQTPVQLDLKPESRQTTADSVATNAGDDGDDADDKTFAKLLDNTQRGISLTSPKPAIPKASSRSQRAQQIGPPARTGVSWENSAAVDSMQSLSTDDEQFTQSEDTPKSMDVSDMLEEEPSKLSVLRIVSNGTPETRKVVKASKQHELPESKKQRQNRRKVEQRKIEKQEDEQQRRVTMERQLKTAREARGEPAKNGLGSVTRPEVNKWSNGMPKPQTTDGTNSNGDHLLDTFEQDGSSATGSNSPRTSGATSVTDGAGWDHGVLSEEEQLRLIQEQDDTAWNTVSKKARKKSSAGLIMATDGGEGKTLTGSLPEDTSMNGVSLQKPNVNRIPTGQDKLSPLGRNGTQNSQSRDSDWAVV